MKRRLFIASVVSLTVAGCSAELNSSTGGKQKTLYLMSSDQADEVMMEAMERNIGLKPVRIQTGEARGYTADIIFGLDRHTVNLTAVPATGVDASGKTVSGYYFQINHSGVMFITGAERARRVLVSAEQLANARFSTATLT